MHTTVVLIGALALGLAAGSCSVAGTSTGPGPASSGAGPAYSEQLAQVWDGPEVSRSVGETGGVLIFWPRIIPSSASGSSRDLARALQAQLRSLVEEALPGRPIDMRPEPERVCPQAGCQAMTVGVLLARRSGGCVAVALVAAPGTSASRLVPWVGDVDLSVSSVPFREPPEAYVTVNDFARCDDLLGQLASGAGRVREAIVDAAP